MPLEEHPWTRLVLPTPAFAIAAFHLLSGSLCGSGLASAGSDSFPKSVPWLGWQAGSGRHPACSLCLLTPAYLRRQGWARTFQPRAPHWTLQERRVGLSWFSTSMKGEQTRQGLDFINEKPDKSIKRCHRVIMTLPDTHFPNCEVRLN